MHNLNKSIGCFSSELLLDRLNDFEFSILSEWLVKHFGEREFSELKEEVTEAVDRILRFSGPPYVAYECAESVARDFCCKAIKFNLNPPHHTKFEDTELGRLRSVWFSLAACCEKRCCLIPE